MNRSTVINAATAALLGLISSPSPAQQQPGTTVERLQESIANLLGSSQIEDSMKANQRRAAKTVEGIDSSAISRTQATMPKFNDFVGKIKYGTHNTVSKNGEQIVALLRATATDPARSTEALKQIQELARAKNPEALNFVGFVLTHGLFGNAKNPTLAAQYFGAAAAANYQPAIYNQAIQAAYSKDRDALPQAAGHISRAAAIAPDASHRVCGLGAFLAYRRGETQQALQLSRGCGSALTNIPRAVGETTEPLAKRIDLLRMSIATGVDDGYSLLEKLTRAHAESDEQYLFCKYSLLRRVHQQRTPSDPAQLTEYATQCHDHFAPRGDRSPATQTMRDQAIRSISTFGTTEEPMLRKLRASNRFHYGWVVPYLPFPQPDVDLFEPLVRQANKGSPE